MPTELKYLAATLVLAIFQILVAAHFRTRETGLGYNASARDAPSPVPPGVVTGRLIRARDNLLETLGIFAGAVLLAHVTGRENSLTYWGATLYFWARIAYVPAYAYGILYLRSAIWIVSLAGIAMILWDVIK